MDGAIDQTYAFNRQTYVQVTAAKIECQDKLAHDVPSAEVYVMQALQSCLQQLGQPVNSFLKDQRQAEMLMKAQEATGVVLMR